MPQRVRAREGQAPRIVRGAATGRRRARRRGRRRWRAPRRRAARATRRGRGPVAGSHPPPRSRPDARPVRHRPRAAGCSGRRCRCRSGRRRGRRRRRRRRHHELTDGRQPGDVVLPPQQAERDGRRREPHPSQRDQPDGARDATGPMGTGVPRAARGPVLRSARCTATTGHRAPLSSRLTGTLGAGAGQSQAVVWRGRERSGGNSGQGTRAVHSGVPNLVATSRSARARSSGVTAPSTASYRLRK